MGICQPGTITFQKNADWGLPWLAPVVVGNDLFRTSRHRRDDACSRVANDVDMLPGRQRHTCFADLRRVDGLAVLPGEVSYASG